MLKTTAAPSQTCRAVILSFAQFCRWLLWRGATGCALAALVLAAWAWQLHSLDMSGVGAGDFQAKRAELLATLASQRALATATAADALKHTDSLQADARAQEQNAADAARSVEAHKALESSWQRWFGDREQQELNDKLLAEAQKKQTDATAKAAALKKELSDAAMSRERANIEVARIDARIEALQKTSSKWEYYARAVWDRGQLVAVAIVAFWILWTPVRRAFFYYFIAPLVVRRKALRLAAPLQREEGVDGITTSESGRTLTISLGANEVLRVKSELIESADDGLARRDRRRLVTKGALFPLTKILCGLTRLAELRKEQPERKGVASDATANTNATADDKDKASQATPLHDDSQATPQRDERDNSQATPPRDDSQAQASDSEDTSTRMVILRGMGKWKGAGPDMRKRRAELVMVVVPRGASLVLRPRYLAGAVSEAEGLSREGRSPDRPTRRSRALLSSDAQMASGGEAPRASSGGLETAAPCASVPRAGIGGKMRAARRARLVVRTHWRFFNWHAWITGQFRFFEFVGPCRLIVAGQRGARVEWIEEREDGLRPVARVEPWALMGFDAALRYRPARAESFWKYCTGARRLYDDLFIGAGMYLAQTTPHGEGRYDTGRIKRLAARCWRRFQKIFGM